MRYRTTTPLVLFLRRFHKDKSGVTALEFALVAPPFFLMLFGIFEVAIIIFASLILESGVDTAARQIRTGVFQSGGGDEASFKQLLCDNMTMLIECDGNLYVDVQVFSDFGTTNFSDPEATENFGENFGYSSAGAGQVVLVRVYYLKPILTPLFGPLLADYGDKRKITWAAAFETEPF